MAIKTLNENPTITDDILIFLETPDVNGCLTSNPYKVNRVVIYYVQRNYTGNNFSQYDKKFENESAKAELDAAIKTACVTPSEENLAEVDRLTAVLDNSTTIETFYYNTAKTVAIFGDDLNPAWLSNEPDPSNNSLVLITTDSDGNPIQGTFGLEWSPIGLREGDYFVCWTWTPNLAGDTLSNTMHFVLQGNTQITTSIPTHFTNPLKYPTLMERYLPEMFKMHLGVLDLTPEVLQEFNEAVAKGFSSLEDMSNQIVDLIDANATGESFLSLLGDLFNLKLKSGDPTLWRRQIKNAIPLYKQKGTYDGLNEALAQIGVKLNKFTRLWQVISKYTHQEAFVVPENGQHVYVLSRLAVLPIDPNNIELYYRTANTDEWVDLTVDYALYINSIVNSDVSTLTWNNSVSMHEGDEFRIVYQINAIPSIGEQTIEDYIRMLPLADQRDELSHEYPLKNWNVRVIEETDPLIDMVIPSRHPYYNPLIYGKIRTEFPYSENIYNMEEYNGSTRDSFDPCDIDKNFMDQCSSCLGSKFVVDLDIENLSQDRIEEAQDIIKEFVPFHAILHSLNLSGSVNELIQSPIEDLNSLVQCTGIEFTISGNSQTIFNRSMNDIDEFKRNELANVVTVANAGTGTGYNERIILYTSLDHFDDIPLNKDPNYNYLEVLSPSANSGSYSVRDPFKSYVTVVGSPTQPLDQSAFTFRLSNERLSQSAASIYQDDTFSFNDNNVDFGQLGVKTKWDITNNTNPAYSGGSWTITIPAYSDTYEIINILPDGSLLLYDPARTLPTSNTNNIVYELKTDLAVGVQNSISGSLKVDRRGRVDVGVIVNIYGNNVALSDVRAIFDSSHGFGANHYILYASNQYAFDGCVEGQTSQFYISGYTSGDVAGVPIKIYQRVINNKKGYFHYQGLTINTSVNYETSLGICNGENAGALFPALDSSGNPYTLQLENDTFYQNYLLLINTNYYAISKIDGNTIWLLGTDENWTTLGTSLTFDILQYQKQPASIPAREYPPTVGMDFDFIDRRGNEVITNTIANDPPSIFALEFAEWTPEGENETTIKEGSNFAIKVGQTNSPTPLLAANLNAAKDQVVETINQQEGITFSVRVK